MATSMRIASAIAVACLLAAAGCGDDSATPVPGDAPTTAPAATSPKTAEGAADSVDRKVDKTGWFDGFKITVDDVAAKVQGGATTLDVKLSYENLVGETSTPPDKAYLEVSGGEVVELSFDSPKIAGFGKGNGTATASLGSTEDMGDLDEVLDEVVLVYGESDGNLTKIPFAAAAEVESLQPRGITVGQTFGEKVPVTLNKAFLWPSYQPGGKGRYDLWVEFTMVCGPNCTGVGYKVNGANFSVTPPGGAPVSADSRSPWKGDVMAPGDTIDGQWLIFVINAPAKGEYQFNLNLLGILDSPEYKVDESTTITL